MRGAQLVTSTLANAGVDVIFTLSGNQILPIFDACIDSGIRLIHTRHEAAAVYMAEAYAQLSGKVGVALIAAGPGFASGLGPLYAARMSESPVVLLSGDSPAGFENKGAFQEMDQTRMSAALTKFSLRPRTSEDLGADVAKAIRTVTSGRTGPVHLALPFDLLTGEVPDAGVVTREQLRPEVRVPTDGALATIVRVLEPAKSPVVLTGPSFNTTRAGGRLAALADALDIAVIPMESPRGLNDAALGALGDVLSQADVIVCLGKRIDFTIGFGKSPPFGANSNVLLVDPESEEISRAKRAFGKRLTLSHQADVGKTIDSLVARGKGGDARAAWRQQVITATTTQTAEPKLSKDTPMHPAALCAAVQRLLERTDHPILIIDGGEFGQWAQACLHAPTRIINGPSGSIGGCLAYALAAKIVSPGATVVVLMGDGTAGFHFAEFETASRYGADFIAVIGHDSRWNAEYQIQLRDYGAGRLNECELNPTRYDLAAAGFGCHGEHVSDPDDLDAALERAQRSGLPACVVAEIEGLPAPSLVGNH